MAKAIFIFAVLLLAAAATIDAGVSPAPAPAPKPGVVLPKVPATKSALVKVLILNKSSKDLVIKVKELGPKAKAIVAKADKWTGVGEFKVSLTLNHILHLTVSVKNEKNMLVTKELALNLFNRVKRDLEGKKFVVLKAVEDRKKLANGKVKKFLSIWLDAKIVLSINLSV